MAKVHVCNVLVLNNPSTFASKLEFEITFECIEDLAEDLEWKIIYVGSAESEQFDQVLDTVYVGPVPEGRHKFVFSADPPGSKPNTKQPSRIPVNDVVGVTVILLTCSYRGCEFIRVGYYVSIEYDDPELHENPPEQPVFEKLQRNILASSPRVTKFKIAWDNNSNETNASSSAANGCPLDTENIPPMPNAVPATRDAQLDLSPIKSGPVQPGVSGDVNSVEEEAHDNNTNDLMEF